MESKYELRSIFLKEFVKRVIEVYRISHNIPQVKPTITTKEELFKPNNITQKTPQLLVQPITPQMRPRHTRQVSPIRMRQIRYSVKPTINIFPNPNTQSNRPLPVKPSLTPNLIGLGLGKLSFLIMDPSVSSIECTGPGKPLIVSKSGIIQSTQIVLTDTEIKSIIEQISEKTRIPIIAGVFKAAFENFIFTSVISNYIGTRFIIQKKPQVPFI